MSTLRASIAEPQVEPAHRQTARREWLPLAIVAALFTGAQLLVVGVGHGPSWDEAVYASQVDPRAPAMDFLAHRARGIVVLASPVVPLTSSFAVLRAYLAVLSGVLLVLAYLPWLRLGTRHAAPLAAFLFASLWVTLKYGPALIPNLHVAFAAVAATGLLLRARDARRPAAVLTACAAAVAYAALMRPTDSVWVVVPLAVAVPFWVGAGRRLPALAALAGGSAIGWLPWLVEAFARFDDPVTRLRQVPAATGSGLHNHLVTYLGMLDGYLSCRACGTDVVGRPELLAVLWALATPPLVGLGLVVAWRRHRLATLLLPTAVAVVTAAPYLFFVEAVAVRFLLPTYALVALPVAEALLTLARMPARPRARGWLTATLAVLLAGHVAVQVVIAHAVAASQRSHAAQVDRVAAVLAEHGVRPPCLVVHTAYDPVAYAARCVSVVRTSLEPRRPARPVAAALARGEPVAVVTTQAALPPGSYLTRWTRVEVSRPGQPSWFVYLPPPPRGAPLR